MNTNHLITMANQIAGFFASYPDETEAAADIAGHIQRFWAPRMRLQLLEHVTATGGAGLRPLALTALQQHRAQLTPQPHTSLLHAAQRGTPA